MATDSGGTLSEIVSVYYAYLAGVVDVCIEHNAWEGPADYRHDIEQVMIDVARDAFVLGVADGKRSVRREQVLGPVGA